MNFLADNWGSLASALGVIISVVGLTMAVRRAGQARSAAEAAKSATVEAREAIGRVLMVVDLERAIALVQRLKELHQLGRWEAALEHYQPLRSMLAGIRGHHPSPSAELIGTIQGAIPQLTVIENAIRDAVRREIEPTGVRNLNQVLNTIQQSLEEMASSTRLAASMGGI